MGIKRYIASADNTITDAFKSDLSTRGTGSNMGAADVLETFSIYAQATTASLERSRILVDFPVTSISTDRTNTDIPASGSVRFYLKLFNAPHGQTLPRDFTLTVAAVSASWEEGHGLDMEEYTDLTHDKVGSSWVNAMSGTTWTSEGGDYHAAPRFDVSFDDGTEDLEVDITNVVEDWIAGTKEKYGLGVFLTASQEDGASRSYYTKKFFGRGSEFFFKRPHLEARWDSSNKDNRSNFYYSSSLAPANDNLNTLYLYNYVRGQLRDLPAVGTGQLNVDIYSGSTGPTNKLVLSPGGSVPALAAAATASHVSTGIYSASVSLTASVDYPKKLYDVWFTGSTHYYTGSIVPATMSASPTFPTDQYVTTITNLRSAYDSLETKARFRLFTRPKNWQPNIYTVASNKIDNTVIENAYYRVFRLTDHLDVIPYGTGAMNHTLTSYDSEGNYFDLDMRNLEPDFAYGIKFVYYLNDSYVEQPETFKFRVEENEK